MGRDSRDAIAAVERIRSSWYTHNQDATDDEGTGLSNPYYFGTMQNATYRGVEYTIDNTAAAPVSATLCYRGVEHNPSAQEVVEAAPATLTYRGVEYRSLQARAKKAARLVEAQAAFTRNLKATAIV